jgi:hypothetical protein
MLRLRTVLEAGEPDASGASGVVVRLGASRGTPLTLGRIALMGAPGAPPIARGEARLCGPEADGHPLAVGIVPKPKPAPPPQVREPSDRPEPPIAPVLAVRHASDDLCLRYWSTPGP